MATPEVRAALRAPFPAAQVKQRQGPGRTKLDYVAGETVINRLLSATAEEDSGYAWQASIQTLERIVTVNSDGDESTKYLAVVQGMLLIAGDAGAGVGAMINPDPDMAVKSANTEALKNAAKNGFGVGLELWDAEYRATLDKRRRAIGGNEQALKALVWEVAKEKLNSPGPTLMQVAELFDLNPGDLADPVVLSEILAQEGIL